MDDRCPILTSCSCDVRVGIWIHSNGVQTIEAEARYAALPIIGCVQCAHRFASIGISLRHSGHFFVVGAAAGSSLCIRATSQFTGITTKKYTAAAISKNEMTALR